MKVSDFHNDFEELEIFLSAFFSLLLSESVLTIYSGHSVALDGKRDWYSFQSPEEVEFAISLQHSGKLRSALYFNTLLAISEKLCLTKGDTVDGILQIEACAPGYAENQHLFLILDQECCWLGNFLFSGTEAPAMQAALLSDYRTKCRNLLWPQRSCSRRKLFADIVVDRKISLDQQEISPVNAKFYLAQTANSTEERQALSLNGGRDYLELTVVEEEMSKETTEIEPVNVRLSLGDIELSTEQLLQLRPGMKIEIEETETLEGTLQIDGYDFAFVSLMIAEQAAIIKIGQIIALSQAMSTSLEETSEKNIRLIDRI